MTVVICSGCGANYPLRSDFELDGPCSECGEDGLLAEDAYDTEPHQLVCTTCGREVDGGMGTLGPASVDDYGAGRYSVEDPCPLCEGELTPRDHAATVRDVAEFKLARSVARKARERAGQTTTPIDVRAIAEAEGYTIADAGGGQGQLRDGTIAVGATESKNAKCWAIAHELGHGLLQHQVPESKVEQEANAFASELVIPRAILRQLVTAGYGFRQLAQTFGVSREALGWALNQGRLTAEVKGR